MESSRLANNAAIVERTRLVTEIAIPMVVGNPSTAIMPTNQSARGQASQDIFNTTAGKARSSTARTGKPITDATRNHIFLFFIFLSRSNDHLNRFSNRRFENTVQGFVMQSYIFSETLLFLLRRVCIFLFPLKIASGS